MNFNKLDLQQLLEVLRKYIDDNKYNCVPEYISFEDWFEDGTERKPRKKDLEEYFEDEYYNFYVLEDYYNDYIKI